MPRLVSFLLLLQSTALPQVSPSIVHVVGYDARGRELSRSAGIIVSKDGHVIAGRSAFHGASRVEVITAKDARYAVKDVVAESISAGLVRFTLGVSEGAVEPLELSANVPAVAEPVVVALDGSKGVVSAVRSIPGLGSVLRITAPISPEAAGSPVLNSKGETVGVAMWQAGERRDAGFVASVESVLALAPGQPRTLAEWQEVAKGRSSPADADYRRGLDQLFLDQYEEALYHFGKAIEKNPQHAEAWFYSGFARGKLGLGEKKIEAYKEAVKIKPDYSAARYSLAVSYLLAGERDLAVAEMKALTNIDPVAAERLQILIQFMSHEEHPAEEAEVPANPAPGKTP